MNTNKNKVEESSIVKTSKKSKETNPLTVRERMAKLESAYESAVSGKMKFGEVKSIFKQLHKEIKKSVKSKN